MLLGARLRGVYRLLAEHGSVLFGDDYFVDLFKVSRKGRPTVPARLVATVMVLQALEGLSDVDACERLERDLAWQAACGTGTAPAAFHPTVLVGMRNRLRGSARPKRLLEDVNSAARGAGLMAGRVRVVDSTPLYDAVATQDTVTQLRAAIRRLLVVLDHDLEQRVRAVLMRDDDYATPGKPPCDWDDPAAREALVDALVRDAVAALEALDGQVLTGAAADAAAVLAVVAGQDVEAGDDGVFRIARRVASDRIISTVDPEARHGHKSRNRRFDGYKAHLLVDPDDELIDEVAVTAANVADHDAVDDLVAGHAEDEDKPTIMGDCAYSDGATRARLADAGFDVVAKVPPTARRQGHYSKDDFNVDLAASTVTCPAGVTVTFTTGPGGAGRADFAGNCTGCDRRDDCTTSMAGRSVTIHPNEDLLQAARADQATPEWKDTYRSTRPKVERKIAHFVRVHHGGRKARTRGAARALTDVVARAAAVNLARLHTLGVHHGPAGWQTAGP